ncbi:SpoIIE family protein phosphatase [Lentzea sp.]|uniref:SpoIIE family protein phosphatase n=1 Tax=Lentzea sp. TaxID=56099 RepID=UPI002C7909EE|nr:SpoIIE family protein phosphatase [Lentzea sp.]HUQ61583.1 SpoIIE family protein phosphatase [Lentzea sp.]
MRPASISAARRTRCSNGWLSRVSVRMVWVTVRALRVQPGDRLVFVSDGVYDVASPAGELYGARSLARAINLTRLLPAAPGPQGKSSSSWPGTAPPAPPPPPPRWSCASTGTVRPRPADLTVH